MTKAQRDLHLPMSAVLLRERKGLYSVILTFIQSGRLYEIEFIYAPNIKEARKKLKAQFPNVKFKR